MESQLQLKQDKDTFYVTPSLQNVILTEKGKILDIVLGKDLGVWDVTSGRCLRVISGIANQSVNMLHPYNKSQNEAENGGLGGELFFLGGDSGIKLYDFDQDKFIVEISYNSFGGHQNIDSIHSYGQKLLILANKVLYFYEDIFKNSKQFLAIPMQNKVDRALFVGNGNIVLYQKLDERLYLLNMSGGNKNVMQLAHTGLITTIIPLQNEFIAVGHNQSIHIIDTERNCIKNMLKGYSEEYISLLYVKEKDQIIAGTSKALIRIWDMKKCRSVNKFGDESDVEYNQIFNFNNLLVSVNNEIRRLKVWNMEKPKDIKLVKYMQGGLKSVQKVVKIDQTTVAMLTTRGEFSMGQMNFTQYLEVVNILTNEHYLDKIINEPGFSLDESSFLFFERQREIFYILKTEDITKTDLLSFQKIEGDFKQRKVEFNVEEHKSAFFFKFGRIVIPWNLSFNPQEIFGLNMGGMGNISGNSGVSIYDFDVKLRQAIKFEKEFVADVVEMSDENNLIFLNIENKLEFWNIQTQQQTQIVECHPNVFKQIKYIDEYIFLLSHNKEEFVLWDAADLDMIQRRKAKKDMKKIELFDGQDCIILYSSGKLELWNVESGEYRDSQIQYSISDFIVQGKSILLIGEGFMQITNRDTL